MDSPRAMQAQLLPNKLKMIQNGYVEHRNPYLNKLDCENSNNIKDCYHEKTLLDPFNHKQINRHREMSNLAGRGPIGL